MSEQVNHPSHYGGDTTYEVVKVEDAWGLDKHHELASAVEYIARFDKKGDEIENLRKAIWWIRHKIKKLKKQKRRADKQMKT